MKKLLLLFIGILSVSFSNAQILDWAKQVGEISSSIEVGAQEVVVDKDGNSYYIGSYYISTFGGTVDFDPGAGVSTGASVSTSRTQAFILKLDPNGSFLWKKLFLGVGISDGVVGNLLTVDSAKNIYFSCTFIGTVDFDPGPGSSTLTSGSTLNYDPCFGMLDSLGNLIFVKQFINTGTSLSPGNIEVDKDGNIILSGDFLGTRDFDTGPGVFSLSSPVGASGFVLKNTNSGNFIWAKNTGIGTTLATTALAIDTAGNIYSAGGGNNILKLNQAGDTVWCVTQDTIAIMVNSIAIDSDNNVVANGYFKGTMDLDPGASAAIYTSVGRGFFVQKFDSLGNLLWVKAISSPSSTNWIYANDLKIDDIDNIYISGTFRNVTIDFDPGTGVYNMTPLGVVGSAFMLRLNSLGNFIWAFQMTNGNCTGYSLFIDAARNIYTTGIFEGSVAPYTNFAPVGTFYLNASGGGDGYFAKYSQSITTDISNIQQTNNSISVYPNPASNNLFFETEEKIEGIVCVNYLGQTINLKVENNSCDISSLSDGIYFLSLTTEGGKVVTKKFIKQ